ncbi:BPSL0067 family protein [Oxalobacteraceae bacterium OTU3CINTB1]|nr:BPSL0067 family protein [Oxalobacteraceae bacterium OTU3CINTB1]
MGMGPIDPETGRPRYILVIDQWKDKRMIGMREIYPRAKLKEDGGEYDDSDNAETFWVVF